MKKTLRIVSLCMLFTLTLFACGCINQEITRYTVPNPVAENASISSQYSQISNDLSSRAKDIFLNDIVKLYHPTGKEEQMTNYLINFAKANNFQYKKNDAGVVIFDVPPTPGFENYPKVILQGHQDMVLTTNDANADLTKFKVDPVFDENTGAIHSRDYQTNIGADDGEGIMTILAICENKDVKHGPLRVIFTTEEEETFKGAKSLTQEDLDADYLINIDSYPVGTVITAAAGGMLFDMDKQFSVDTIPNCDNVSIRVHNLVGGHSGESIHRPRLSAQGFMQDAMKCLNDNSIEYGIFKWQGGNTRNTITNDSTLDISVDKAKSAKAKELIEKLFKDKLAQCTDEIDPKIDITIDSQTYPSISYADSRHLIEILTTIPHGLIKTDNNGFPITSYNIGVVKVEGGVTHVGAMYRTSDQEALTQADKSIQEICKKHNIGLDFALKFPIWPQSDKTGLQDLFLKSYTDVCGFRGSKIQIHGGLECGYIHEVKPDIVIASIGADVAEEHGLGETLFTKSLPAHFASILYTLEHINACA